MNIKNLSEIKILSLGLDPGIFDKGSQVIDRIIEYSEIVDEITMIVPFKKEKTIKLSEKVCIFGVGSVIKAISFFKIYYFAKKLLTQKKFDIIIVQDQYYLAFVSWLLAKKFNLGFEIQLHGFEKFYGLRKIIAKFIMKRAGAVRVVSERLKYNLIKNFNVKAENITVVPIYVEIKNKKGLYKEYKKKNDNFIFLTIGRLVKIKNIKMQIKAMKEILKEHKDIELWIIGDGPERKKLEKEALKLNLIKNIKFLGYQENLDIFYLKADAFILTSDSEGWSMVIIEAASYGLPIIMTDVGCAGEVVKNNESSIIIPVGGEKELIESMLNIIKNENLRKKLGENAQRTISSLPNKEKTIELYKESWIKTLNNKIA